jgi:hypothetical protein
MDLRDSREIYAYDCSRLYIYLLGFRGPRWIVSKSMCGEMKSRNPCGLWPMGGSGVATSNKTQETTHWAISHPSSCGPRIAHNRGVGRPCPLPATSGQVQVPRLCSALLEMLRTPWVAIVQLQCSKWVHSRDNVADWRCYRICTCRRTFLKLLRPL